MTLIEIEPPDTRLAFATLLALRPSVVDETTFARRVDEIQHPEGYRLVGVFEHDQDYALAAPGFRVSHRLASADSYSSMTCRPWTGPSPGGTGACS